jgi:ribosomal protein S18 acetylase RimI-like enzyme
VKTPRVDRERVRIRAGLRPGDIGYITYLHGILYAEEYHYDTTFDGYVALGIGEFAKAYNPGKDCLWVAEADGQIVGSIAIVGRPGGEAQLRWFLVHPAARGQGWGRALLEEALRFCREKGVGSVFLWTVGNLEAAVHLYRSVGFERTEQQTHHIWGQALTEERYDLSLRETDQAPAGREEPT